MLPPLIPMPREAAPLAAISLAHGVRVETAATPGIQDRFTADDLLATLAPAGTANRAATNPHLWLLSNSGVQAQRLLTRYHQQWLPAMDEEGYILIASGAGIYLIAHTPAGRFYASQTLKQLVTHNGIETTLHGAIIRDWPAMRYRGFQDDLSRGPVPTLAFQEQQIRTLAAYKVNLYSPYYEHTLASASNPLAGLPGGSMSPEDVRNLTTYAAKYHITVVPEQESFGHLHNVLTFEKYQPLAEVPFGTVLAPGQPGSLDLIGKWFTDIATLFPNSPFLHIGADETAELGRGQTKSEVDKQGLGLTYVQFLTQIYNKLQPLHRRLLFWGDIAMGDPPAVKQLPHDMIAVAWWYDPEPQGFDKWIRPYLDAGMETWVAPGVNNWNRVWPDNDYALRNIQRFTADGQAAHSTGQLNTVWDDDGEGMFNDDWYGLLFGAAAAWQPGSSSIPQYQQAYGPVFHHDLTGKLNAAQQELIAAYQLIDTKPIGENTDNLFWVDPWSPQGIRDAQVLRPLIHDFRTHAENAITLIAEARDANPALENPDAIDAMELGARRLDMIGLKFEAADRAAAIYAAAYQASQSKDKQLTKGITDQLYLLTGNNGICDDMRNMYSYSRVRYQDLWLRENRPYFLPNILAQYDLAEQLWITRNQSFVAQRTRWAHDHTLAPPQELGIPAIEGAQ